MKSYTQDELRELLPAYALGALSADEAAAVESALVGSAGNSLRRELNSYQELVVQMATAKPVVPPAGVKERLLARVAREKQVALPPPAPRRMPATVMAALAAALVLAVGLGAYSLVLRDSLGRSESTLAALREREVLLRDSLAQRETTLNAILEAQAQLRVAHLVAVDNVPGPGIQFFWNERQKRGVLHAFGLPPARAGRAYQLWLIQDGKPVSVSVFNSDADGHALVENLSLPETSRGTTLVAVTDEPAGGSPGPTTAPFLAGPLSAPR